MPISKIDALHQNKVDAIAAARALTDLADTESRDLTTEELATFDGHQDTITSLDAKIAREQKLAEQERASGSYQRIEVGQDQRELDPVRGFDNYGEFAASVMAASAPGGTLDERLLIGAAPTTYGNVGTGSDGGFAVPEQFSNNIRGLSLEEGAFLPMTDSDVVAGNSMSYPTDETTPWGSSGVRAYWEGEAQQAAQTKPVLNKQRLELHKLFALVPITDELLADTGALSGYLERKTGESIRWKTNDAIINGTGAGMPSGILNANALVLQAKVTSQTADTINATNCVKMFSRSTNPGGSVWVINPDSWNQLPLMTLGDQPVFMAPNGMVSAPGGILLGRPVIMSDTCQTLGDKGDIYFIDFGAYKTITKSGIQTETSIHLWFDYDVAAFRATFRVDGQSSLAASITPPNSAVTRSPFVTLAVRT